MDNTSDSPASYIHMVHHLIEKCLIFHMTKEECMEALYKHARIKPVITSTVWNELEKMNKEFFKEYAESQNKNEFFKDYAESQNKNKRMQTEGTRQLIHTMIGDSSRDSDDVG